VVRLASRCVTTEAVVTEACYMVARGGARAALVIEFLLEAQIPVLALDGEMLRHAAQLMDRYENIPMDFADAALVTIADGLDLTTALSSCQPRSSSRTGHLRASRRVDV
jgi:predicted nucleic acid-binding protein